MNKGERTRELILNRGMLQSSQHGLADISIGSVSKLSGLSRTGVISHFKNKDDMQIAILQYAEAQFIEQVIKPSRKERAFEQFTALFDLWVNWTTRVFHDKRTSCPFIKAVVEYEHRDASPVKEHVFKQQAELIRFLAYLVDTSQQQGDIPKTLVPQEVALELYSLYVGLSIATSLSPESGGETAIRQTLQRALSRLARA